MDGGQKYAFCQHAGMEPGTGAPPEISAAWVSLPLVLAGGGSTGEGGEGCFEGAKASMVKGYQNTLAFFCWHVCIFGLVLVMETS